jgi:hypothetical protein
MVRTLGVKTPANVPNRPRGLVLDCFLLIEGYVLGWWKDMFQIYHE